MRTLALVLWGLLSVSNVDAATINAASCSQSAVTTAIASAVRNVDTVAVPPGTCAWSGLTVTKGITLRGAGVASTFITTTDNALNYLPDSTARSNDEKLEISGFSMTSSFSPTAGSGIIHMDNTDPAKVVSFAPIRNIIIHDMAFHSVHCASPCAKQIFFEGNIYGVIYHNTFDGNYFISMHNGLGYADWLAYPSAPGTYKAMYIEDNTFTPNPFPYTEAGQGTSFYVQRYNTWNMSSLDVGDMADCHGEQGEGGCQGMESYGNSILGGTFNDQLATFRGGQGLFFFNKADNQYNLQYQENHQCGPEQIMNTYDWNNYYGSTLMLGSETADVGNCLSRNVSYWSQNVSYNGTSQIGVFVGSSLPGSCTIGDGAWITAQTTGSSMTGMVGRDPSTPINGTLYRCGAGNNWTAYYTPYTYPHPLRTGGTPPDTTPPAPPTNIRIATRSNGE